MGTIQKFMQGKSWFLLLILFLLALNWAASQWHARIDLTAEKRYTLSHSTRKLLKGLKEPLEIDVFLQGQLPSAFKNMASAAGDLLREFREAGGQKIRYRFISPDDKVPGTQTAYSDTLQSLGLFPLNLTIQVKDGQQQQYVYPVALVKKGPQWQPVRLFQGRSPMVSYQELNNAAAMMEYELAYGISKITRKEKPVIGYALGHGQPSAYDTYDLFEETLKPDYQVFSVNLSEMPAIPTDLKALLLVKPARTFTEADKLKLDQYVMKGGKLLIFLDRLNAEMDSLQILNEVVAYDRDLQLNDLLFRYGVRVNPDLLMDLQCDYLPFDVNGNGQFEFLPWNYFPVLESNPDNPVTRNLGFVSGKFVNSLDTVEAEGIRKSILLSSSPNARTISTPALISGRENVQAAEDEKFKKNHVPAAVMLEGKFRSLFANRLSASLRDSLAKHSGGFTDRCAADNQVMVAGDGDLVLNAVVKGGQPIPMGMNPYTYGSQREFPFANRNFVLNSLEYMLNTDGLTEAKNREPVTRLLDAKKLNAEKQKWQIINLLVPVLFVLISGAIYQGLRKRKYARKNSQTS